MSAQAIGAALRAATDQIRAGGVDSPRLTAEVLLAHVLGLGRAQLLARLEQPLAGPDAASYWALVARAAADTPLAYLTGRREFFGLEFDVDESVLVPRPETELLVEVALEGLATGPAHVIDVGTGSGNIGVTLAVKRQAIRVTAIDRSAVALAIARRNAERHGVDQRMRFFEQDLLDPSPPPADLICANLPYIPSADVATLAVSRHEPKLALDGGPDGLDLIRRLIAQSGTVLTPVGRLVLEIEARQGPAVSALCRDAFPRAAVRVLRDFANLDRVVVLDRGV